MAEYEKALQPGTVLQGNENSYRIDRVLGQGTFGITYLAYTRVAVKGALGSVQTEMPVAVKEFFMRDINGREGSTVTTGGSRSLFDKYKHKFMREARSIAGLQHPGIVQVVETFEVNGTSYYAMEYCSGGSLDALIARREGIPQGEALGLFGQMASALAYMHSRHVLHLDLKPGNVMLRGDGRAVLIDFGLAKQYNEDGDPESSTTIGGGTPGYAPIEQADYNEEQKEKKGQKKRNPMTMDIYALGATLYKMLTSERPPKASEVNSYGLPEQPLRDHGVSGNVVAAIRRAMQPIAENRYQTVADFAAALGIAIEVAPHDEDVEIPRSEETQPEDDEVKEVILVDDGKGSSGASGNGNYGNKGGRASGSGASGHIPHPEPQPEPTPQPRRKWLPWTVAVGVAAVVFVAIMLLRPQPDDEPIPPIPPDIIAAVTSGVDTVSQQEQPQQPVQQPVQPQVQQQPQQQLAQQPMVQQPEPERPQSNLPEIEMVWVSGGTFTMGATSEQGSDAFDWEKPAHSVTLSGYYIGKYEVTQKLWKAVMGSNPSNFKGDNLPVENVSWNDVQEFIRKLNQMTGKKYRLPTEAEWEYAARGGGNSRGYKYSGSDNVGSVAWYYDNSGSTMHPVGSKTPNDLGIYDMSGNVWEWCQDWYSSNYYSSSPQRNPQGPASGSRRVERGGGWDFVAGCCRVSFRDGITPDKRGNALGFRLAL